jgi:hypothetical protein
MVVDVASRKSSFAFAPDVVGSFGVLQEGGDELLFARITAGSGETIRVARESLGGERVEVCVGRISCFIFEDPQYGDVPPCDIEVSDSIPLRSPPYRCAPPKVVIFRKIIDELLEQGVIRPSKSPYASPAFLIPKSGGDFCMVVGYWKVNAKVVFDSYPMPTIEQAFEQFGGAVRFSVLDLNSAYYQMPLSEKSRRITAFCTPFGLFEFNKLPMGISVGCQGLSRVVDELFADLKGIYVFNFLDDLVVYSISRRAPDSPTGGVREVREGWIHVKSREDCD